MSFWQNLGNESRNTVRPQVAKWFFKPIKLWPHESIRPISQNSLIYKNLQILRWWDFVVPWPISPSIFEMNGLYFDFVYFKNHVLQPRHYILFLKFLFFWYPKGWSNWPSSSAMEMVKNKLKFEHKSILKIFLFP